MEILKFQEHDLKIEGTEDTIVDIIKIFRSCDSDLPTTINDIIFSMEIEIKALRGMDEDDWDF